MRQTLLANEMTKAKEYGTTDYMHLHKTEGSFLKYIEVDATEHAQSSYIKWIYLEIVIGFVHKAISIISIARFFNFYSIIARLG